jgi:hypothetical protein
VTRGTLKPKDVLSSATHQNNRGAKPSIAVNSKDEVSLPLTGTVSEEEPNLLVNSMSGLSFADQEIEGARSTPLLKPKTPLASLPQTAQTAEPITAVKFSFNLQAVRQITGVAE